MKKKKQKTLSRLKREADATFSKWILKRDKYICFTCGRPANQNAHYVSRTWLGLRYSEVNCNASCFRCNIVLRGNMDEYARALIAKYGDGILNMLAKMKKPTQMKRKDYEEIIAKYEKS